jgi:hypothetical protein
MDRSAMTQALAKALAYQAAGKSEVATEWAHKLIELMRDAGIAGLRH